MDPETVATDDLAVQLSAAIASDFGMQIFIILFNHQNLV